MKVVVLGALGQLGCALRESQPSGLSVIYFSKQDLDITNATELKNTLLRENAQYVINATAFTAVDLAETEVEKAFAVNASAVESLAKICGEAGIKLIHISTDFVFAGNAYQPYKPSDACSPLNVYGESKRAGELAIAKYASDSSVVVRTSWLYGANGNNFVKTMLRLFRERETVNVVCDQVGCPTLVDGLANWIWRVCKEGVAVGVYHWCDAGVASWYDFAKAVQELAIEKGVLTKRCNVLPIYSENYPTAAQRPSYSVLDTRASVFSKADTPVYWRENLSLMLDKLKEEISNV